MLDLSLHPFRISDGKEWAHFANFHLAVETARERGWAIIEWRGQRGQYDDISEIKHGAIAS